MGKGDEGMGGGRQEKNERAGKMALVTGASGGLGEEFARSFAADGYDVMLVARSEDKLERIAREIEDQHGVCAAYVPCDLSQPGAAISVVAAVEERGAEVEVLVNNAGFGYDAPFAKSDGERQRALVQVNDVALTELCHAFIPGMVERKRGYVLNVASIAGFMPGPGMATYYASKAYVQSLTQALRLELLRSGVHVTALCPGPVSTDFWNAADAGRTALAHLTLPAKYVVRVTRFALRCNKALCVPGILPKLVVFSSRLLPRRLLAGAAALLQHQPRL